MSTDLVQFLANQEDRFVALDSAQVLDWKQECLYAKQQIQKSNFTLGVAQSNPGSLQSAILNVAAIGISLNPAQAHAYLVPRDKAICLDISYKGLVKLATDCGAVKDCKSVLVYAQDTFEWNGPYSMPTHTANVFSDERGDVIGAYNIAYLPDGRVMVDTMSRKDLNKVQATSKAANGPWATWWDQMALKTMTKRAYKSWPQTENRERLDRAVSVLHESEGMAYTIEQQEEYLRLLRSGSNMDFYLFVQSLSESAYIALYNGFARGEKVSNKKANDEKMSLGFDALGEAAADLSGLIDQQDSHGIKELQEEMGEAVWEILGNMLTNQHRHELEQNA